MLFFKNNEIPDVAESCFRVAYCKLLFLSINSSAGLNGTTTQRPCLCPKVHAITASTAVILYGTKTKVFIGLQCKTQLQLHTLVHITTFVFVNPQGRPVAPARGKPAPRPCRGSRRCRRAGGVSPRSGAALRRCRGLRGAALPAHIRPPHNGKGCVTQRGRRGSAVEDGHQPGGSRTGAPVTAEAEAPGGAQDPALPARPGREGGRRVEETPPAFIARTAPGCAGSPRRRGALSGDSDLRQPCLSCPSRLCPADGAPGLQPGPASPEVDSVLSALLPAAAPDLVQPGAGARNKPCPL